MTNDTVNLKLFEDLVANNPKLTKSWNASQVFASELNEVGKCPVTKYKIEKVVEHFSRASVSDFNKVITLNELDGTITVIDFTKTIFYWEIWMSA